MSALICGSIAFDTIMVYSGQFKNEILPDQVHMLNVSFLVPDMRREFGGCAGNIGYSLSLLGGEGQIMATVGKDFDVYGEWMDSHGIDRQYVKVIDEAYTAQAYITTDLDDNQITAFHPGAMNHAHEQTIPADAGITLGVVSPDGKDGMVAHAEQFAEAGIDFMFDPGQGLPMFNGDELKDIIGKAAYLAVNDYESKLVQDRTGLSEQEIADQLKALIVTRGGNGSVIYADGQVHRIPAGSPSALADPTGCGDAFRAGLIYGLQQGHDWETTGRIASLLGTIKIERPGTQNHHFTMDEFKTRFAREFGHELG
ncbi:carbohydrate kinase family protein [Salinisphaera sp. Q1T1-3]|uniref:carbohydrate kinase family protein n=1 Tax=Salinisphaera sp. Q1T1-3 TaxID=2321229 RepID=UPI000E76E848|nr:carbohydrate kinase family protein [Salinisphaera sp. Q1T1-3]RJS92367.1 carbohydrate kinase family protein [Salinisphaera sp. Q1T1-3]